MSKIIFRYIIPCVFIALLFVLALWNAYYSIIDIGDQKQLRRTISFSELVSEKPVSLSRDFIPRRESNYIVSYTFDYDNPLPLHADRRREIMQSLTATLELSNQGSKTILHRNLTPPSWGNGTSALFIKSSQIEKNTRYRLKITDLSAKSEYIGNEATITFYIGKVNGFMGF